MMEAETEIPLMRIACPHYAIEDTALLGGIWTLGFSNSHRMVLPKDSLLLSFLRTRYLAKVVVLEEWEKVLHEKFGKCY